MSWGPDLIIGELRPWPDSVHVLRGVTGEGRDYLPERTARRARVTVDERRTIGHDECGACGATVGMADRFCRMCGARLEGEE